MFVASESASPPSIKHGKHVCSMAGDDCTKTTSFVQRLPSADDAATLCRRLQLRCNNPRPLSDLGYHHASQLHELPNYQPLPAVRSDCWSAKSRTSCQQVAKETSSILSIDSGFITSDSPALSDKHTTSEELDIIFQLFDRSVVLVWLEQSKRSITDISDWCAADENFIHFAHFWLSEFPSDRRLSMFEFEYGLLRDKIASGCRSKPPSSEQLASFLTAILHEFPEGRLTGLADAYIFLEHLEALAEKQKRDSLLTAVSYSLCSQQYYDYLLAVRTYAIVTIWSAILDKYRSGVDSVMASQRKKSARPSTAREHSTQPSSARLQSARLIRPSMEHSKSQLELKPLEDEVVANADISSQNRLPDAIRLVNFCFIVLFAIYFTLQVKSMCSIVSVLVIEGYFTNSDLSSLPILQTDINENMTVLQQKTHT